MSAVSLLVQPQLNTFSQSGPVMKPNQVNVWHFTGGSPFWSVITWVLIHRDYNCYNWMHCLWSRSQSWSHTFWSRSHCVMVSLTSLMHNCRTQHTQLNSTGNHGRRWNTSKSASVLSNSITKTLSLITSSDRFPIPVKSVIKSNLTAWSDQNLCRHNLNALTVLAFTTKFGKLF